jgi:hypothetical protein
MQLRESKGVVGTEVATPDDVGAGVAASGEPEVHPAAATVAMQIRSRASTFAFIRLRIGLGNIKPGAGAWVHCRLYQDLSEISGTMKNTWSYKSGETPWPTLSP